MVSRNTPDLTAPCPSPFNMAQYVLVEGLNCPDKTALAVVGGEVAETWSYAELRTAVLGTARGLLQAGAVPGDRVLMRLGNSAAFPITYLAAIAVGLIPVPTSAQLTTPEVTRIAAEITPRLIVAEPGVALPEAGIPVIGPKDLRAMQCLDPAEFEMGDPNRPAYIIYTSGTSGVPRAVTHAHRAIWARRMMWQGWYGLRAQDRMLHAGAFNWTYTLGTGLMDPWAIGATALIPAQGTLPADLPGLLAAHEATIFAAAPGVYRQMLRADVPALPALRHGLSAGEKLPDATREYWHAKTGTVVHEAFGMSECSTFLSGSPDQPAPAGSLGFAQQGRRVSVLADGVRVPPGQAGILAVSTDDPGLMLGYWDAARNGPSPVQGTWFETGDTCAMDESGAVRYLGRADDMMNAGGFRVSPIEVERVMNSHPQITECAAVAVRVKADVRVIGLYYVSDSEIDEGALAAHAAKALATYKQPRMYRKIELIPKGGNGKIQRQRLRE